MIFPSNRVRILVAANPVDFRKGHDGLATVVQNTLLKEPFDGTIFIFRSKRKDRLKLICRDGSGLVMTCKRLESSGFVWPPVRDGVLSLSAARFEVLFAGLDRGRIKALDVRRPTAAE